MKEEKKGSGGVQTLERALKLLRMVAARGTGMSLAELCAGSGLNRTTVWRLISALEENQFVERDVHTKNYVLGYGATTLCTEAHAQYAPLIRAARPYMERLCETTQESVLLTVHRYGGVLTIDQIDSPQAVCIKNYVDTVNPLHCSSNGKLFLSTLSEEELDAALKSNLNRTTDRTISDPEKLREEIAQTRERGYGIVEGELDESENGISVAIRDANGIAAFLNVSGPSFRFSRADMEKAAPQMLRAAADISEQLMAPK